MIDRNYIVASTVPIGPNVPDAKIDPYIPRALRDLRGIMTVNKEAALFDALSVLAETQVQPWSALDTYTTGQRVLHSEQMWQAVQGSTGQVPSGTNTANWSEVELGTFLVAYVQPYLAHHVYCGYAVNGGVNVTHQGLQEISNETAASVSGAKLDAYLSYWQGELRGLRLAMLKHLDDMQNVFDGVSYLGVEFQKKDSTFSIRAVGHTNILPYPRWR